MKTKLILLTLLFTAEFSAPSFSQSKDYLGAEIRTTESFLYGKFEVKMKSVECSGMLSSFFTFYDSPDFVTNWNEIDIEILGRYSNEVQFNTITPGDGKRAPHEKRYVLDYNPHEEFHTYAIVWTPTYIAFEVDNKEVYRDAGEHIKEMNKSQKLMMNIWSTIWEEWTGPWKAENLPLTAYYDEVKYYKLMEDGTFKLDWSDDFDKMDNGRWQFATHTFDGNLVQFTPNNGKFADGKLQLILSKAAQISHKSVDVVKTPTDVKLESGKIKKNKLTLTFSNKLEKSSATDFNNYTIEGVEIKKVKLVTDYSTEKQNVNIICSASLSGEIEIKVAKIKDIHGNELPESSLIVK